MIVEHIIFIFKRDLFQLKKEIESYPNESSIWEVRDGISNASGNLVLHIIGNLNTYIGTEIGKTGYVRNRELEFSQKNIPRYELLKSIDNTIKIIETSLETISPNDLEKEFTVEIWKNEKPTIGFVLIHLTTHLAYHLGQINYHRRLLSSN